MNTQKMSKRLRKLADALEFGDLTANPPPQPNALALEIYAKTGEQVTMFWAVEGSSYSVTLPPPYDTELQFRCVRNKL